METSEVACKMEENKKTLVAADSFSSGEKTQIEESCSKKRKRTKSKESCSKKSTREESLLDNKEEDDDFDALNKNKNMAQGLDYVLKSMGLLLLEHAGVNEYHLLLRQVKLLLQSLRIRKAYLILTLKLLNKDYDSEQHEYDSLKKKISDLQVEHANLITNALKSLIKGHHN